MRTDHLFENHRRGCRISRLQCISRLFEIGDSPDSQWPFHVPARGRRDLELLVARGRVVYRVQTRIDPRIPVPPTTAMSFDFSYYVTSAVRYWELSERRVPRPTAETVFATLVGQGHCDSEEATRSLGNKKLPTMLLLIVWHYPHTLEPKIRTDQSVLSEYWEPLRDAILAIWHVAIKRYLYVTQSGRLALGCTLEPGDEIHIFNGC